MISPAHYMYLSSEPSTSSITPRQATRQLRMQPLEPSPPTSIQPDLNSSASPYETPKTREIISRLQLKPHIQGGYFAATDRDPLQIPNPFATNNSTPSTRAASTTNFYFLSSGRPVGTFYRNKARTIHTLHWGRARYTVIHADEASKAGQKVRVESFIAGNNIAAGEKPQWVVEGGKYKSCFLLPNEDTNGLLITEVKPPPTHLPFPSLPQKNAKVPYTNPPTLFFFPTQTLVPGSESESDSSECESLREETLCDLVTPAQTTELKGLLRREEETQMKHDEIGRKPRHWEKFGMMI